MAAPVSFVTPHGNGREPDIPKHSLKTRLNGHHKGVAGLSPSMPSVPSSLLLSVTHPRIDWEFPRKIYHSLNSLVVIFLYASYPSSYRSHDFIPLLLPAFLLYFYLDHRRLHSPPLNALFVRWMGRTMRASERTARQLTSSSAYMAGVLLCLCWWERDVATMSILFLAWGDTAAALGGRAGTLLLPRNANRRIGVRVSRRGVALSNKTVCGFAAAAAVAAAVFAGMQLHNARQLVAQKCAVAGLIGGVAESLTIDGVDDDLSMPLIAGALLTLLHKYLDI